jgi:Calcineurin-like phosphoesterase
VPPRTTRFLAVAAHHPLYSNGKHRDNPKLIAPWDFLLRRKNVDLYLSGHDHDLQQLEFKGHPTSFVISGGGGGGARRLDDASPGARTIGSSRDRIYRLADLKGGSGGQTYRQGCNRPLRVQSRPTSSASNNLLSQRTCPLQSRLLVHESTVRQESSSQVDGGNKKHQRPEYPHEGPRCDLVL